MPASSLEKAPLLIVDDETEIHDILSKRLTHRGFVCHTASNGLEALQNMQASYCPLVIMDIKMPVMNGLEALAKIMETWPRTQVILLSGHADMQLAIQAMEKGAFGYLMKPVDFDDLLFKLEDALLQLKLEKK